MSGSKTRQDIKKQLNYEVGQPQASKSRKAPSAEVAPSQSSRRSTRTGGKKDSAGTFNLDKMSSTSFLNLIGEGASTTAISANKALKDIRTNEEKLKLQMMLTLNAGVIDADQVDVGSDSGNEADNNPQEGTTSVTEKISKEAKVQNKEDVPQGPLIALKANVTNRRLTNVPLSPLKSNPEKKTEEKEKAINDADLKEAIESSNFEEHLDNESYVLDATIPVIKSINAESQTDDCCMFCTCAKCKDLVKNFSIFLNKGYGVYCVNTHEHAKGLNDSKGSVFSFHSSSQQIDEQTIPLFKGCPIKISFTCKGKLKVLDSNPKAEAKDYAYAIMEDLFEPNVLANMTAEGRTAGSIKMEPKLKNNVLVYLQNKFDGMDMTILNEMINNKCYCERRKLWGKDSSQVRKPLVKNIKKVSEPETTEDNASKHKEKNSSSMKKSKDAVRVSKNRKVARRKRGPLTPKKSPSKKPRSTKTHRKESSSSKEKRKTESHSSRSEFGGKHPKPLQEILAINEKEKRKFELGNCSPLKKRKVSTSEVLSKKKAKASHKGEFLTSTPNSKKGHSPNVRKKRKEFDYEEENEDSEKNEDSEENESEVEEEESDTEQEESEEDSIVENNDESGMSD